MFHRKDKQKAKVPVPSKYVRFSLSGITGPIEFLAGMMTPVRWSSFPLLCELVPLHISDNNKDPTTPSEPKTPVIKVEKPVHTKEYVTYSLWITNAWYHSQSTLGILPLFWPLERSASQRSDRRGASKISKYQSWLYLTNTVASKSLPLLSKVEKLSNNPLSGFVLCQIPLKFLLALLKRPLSLLNMPLNPRAAHRPYYGYGRHEYRSNGWKSNENGMVINLWFRQTKTGRDGSKTGTNACWQPFSCLRKYFLVFIESNMILSINERSTWVVESTGR